MYRRQFAAMMIAVLTLFPLSAHADARITAAGALIDGMISDLETFLATDTGDEDARTAEIDRVLSTYFDMEIITRFSAGQYWRAASADALARTRIAPSMAIPSLPIMGDPKR